MKVAMWDMKVALWDLDNTVANDGWRMQFINWSADHPDARYERYHRRCGGDEPGNVGLFDAMCSFAVPIFVTSRPEYVRLETEQWIASRLGIHRPVILMRGGPDDVRPTAEMKAEMVKEVWRRGCRIVAAFDDREDVVTRYREMGIDAARVWIHTTCAMTNPMTKERTIV